MPHVRSERDITREKLAIVDNAEAIKLLNAEWSSLTRPERIQFLAQTQLGMKPMAPDQFVTEQNLSARLDALVTFSQNAAANPIDDVLKKMQRCKSQSSKNFERKRGLVGQNRIRLLGLYVRWGVCSYRSAARAVNGV